MSISHDKVVSQKTRQTPINFRLSRSLGSTSHCGKYTFHWQ